jgi:predicted Ser/Thr protein kinase
MTPEQYAQVKAAFQSAVDLPEDQRVEFVRSHYGEDEAVLCEVESLLRHHFDATRSVQSSGQDQTLAEEETANETPFVSKWFDDSPPSHAPTLTRKLRRLGPAGMVPLGGLVVCVLLLIVSWYANRSIHVIANERREEDIQSVLGFVERAMHTWVQGELSEAQRVVGSSDFRQSIIEMASEIPGDAPLESELVANLQRSIDDELATYLGAGGRYQIWSRDLTRQLSSQSSETPTAISRELIDSGVLEKALAGDPTLLFPAPTSQPSSTTTQNDLRLVFPVRGHNHEVIAVILLCSPRITSDFQRSLNSLRIGDTGEAFAFNQKGFLLTESRFTELFDRIATDRKDSTSNSTIAPPYPLALRVPPRDLTRPSSLPIPNDRSQWAATELLKDVKASIAPSPAPENPRGILLTGYKNYLGYPTYGAWRWLTDYDMGIAYEVSTQEANRPYWFLKAQLYFIAALMLICSTGLIAALLSVRRLQRRARQFEEMGPYRLLKLIGEGGMGQVFLAQHSLLKRPTAVKLLKPEYQHRNMARLFDREVQIASQLAHPNTIEIYDYGESELGQLYFAMEYVQGTNLKELIEAEAPIEIDKCLSILLQISEALAEAHAQGVIHRDIKPQNIMVGPRGMVEHFVKVLDFGLATVLDSHATERIRIAGTLRYMAPECFLDPTAVGPPSDVYSLSAVAYEMLLGTTVPPMNLTETTEIGAWAKRLEDLAHSLPHSADPRQEGLRLLIIAGLSTNLSIRPKNASEFVQRLRQIRSS